MRKSVIIRKKSCWEAWDTKMGHLHFAAIVQSVRLMTESRAKWELIHCYSGSMIHLFFPLLSLFTTDNNHVLTWPHSLPTLASTHLSSSPTKIQTPFFHCIPTFTEPPFNSSQHRFVEFCSSMNRWQKCNSFTCLS